MATLFTGLFVLGWFQARKRQADAHHWLMLGGMISMLSFFIAYYLFRQLGVLAVEGKEGFGGSQALYDHVFIPVLVVHIILVIIGLVMAIYMIILGFRAQMFVGDRRQLNEAPLVTTWKRIGTILGATTVLALLAFALRAGSLLGLSGPCRFCTRHRNDHSAPVARRRTAAPRVGPVHDDYLLHLVCDRNVHLHDALYLVPRKNWITHADLWLRALDAY
jgi:uncharacterized membrane protein YozB (DUF420 family)